MLEGRRRCDDLTHPQPGDYFWLQGRWYGMAPNGLLANLAAHKVTEHDDGTITVYPSILVDNGEGGKRWHGFLERGVWREC